MQRNGSLGNGHLRALGRQSPPAQRLLQHPQLAAPPSQRPAGGVGAGRGQCRAQGKDVAPEELLGELPPAGGGEVMASV